MARHPVTSRCDRAATEIMLHFSSSSSGLLSLSRPLPVSTHCTTQVPSVSVLLQPSPLSTAAFDPPTAAARRAMEQAAALPQVPRVKLGTQGLEVIDFVPLPLSLSVCLHRLPRPDSAARFDSDRPPARCRCRSWGSGAWG